MSTVLSRRTGRALLAVAIAMAAGVATGALNAAADPTPDAAAASGIGLTITRAEVLARAEDWVRSGLTYNTNATADDGGGTYYRRDCSGLVSMAWHISSAGGGPTTHDFIQENASLPWHHLNSLDDLLPGDAIVRDGSSVGSNHMELFVRWKNPANHQDGAWFYSFNSTGESVRNPNAPSNYGNLGARPWSDADQPANGMTSFTPIRYSHIADGPIANRIYLKYSHSSGIADESSDDGDIATIPVAGDWNSNTGSTTFAFNPYTAEWRYFDANLVERSFYFGLAGDAPIIGDWNGDGRSTVGVFRPSTGQFLLNNANDGSAAEYTFYYGAGTDKPVVGDWNGDGVDTVGVFRPGTAAFYLNNANDGSAPEYSFYYGGVVEKDKPVVGDWNGDGIDTIGVYRPGTATFYLNNANDGSAPEYSYVLGDPGWTPIVGNWTGTSTDYVGLVVT